MIILARRSSDAVMDLGGWLRSLGLERYEAAFRENAIDFSVLPDVTDQDLEKLGVLLGHRRKLLRAIANLEASAKTAPDASTVPASVDTSPRDTNERRQVTVMFSDLGSHFGLSEVRCRDRGSLWWFRREVHGRWCAGVLRVSASP